MQKTKKTEAPPCKMAHKHFQAILLHLHRPLSVPARKIAQSLLRWV